MVMAFTMASYFMVVTLVPLTALALGVSPAGVGALASATFVAPLFVAIPIGLTLDRRGPRRFLVAGTAIAAALPVLASLAVAPGSLAAMQIGIGLAQIMVVLGGQSLAASIGPREHRLRNYGWFTMAVSLGHMGGPIAAGLAFDTVGHAPALALAGIGSTAALATALILPVPRTQIAETTTPMRLHDVRRLWRIGDVRTGMIASSAVLLAVAVNQAFLPVMLTARDVPATTIGLLLSTAALAALLIRPFVGPVVRRLGRSSTAITVVALIVAAGLFVIGLDIGLALIAVAIALIGLGSGVSQPLSMTMVVEAVDPGERGRALGIRITLNRLGQLAAPIVAGVIATYATTGSAFLATAVAVAIVVIASRSRSRGGTPTSG